MTVKYLQNKAVIHFKTLNNLVFCVITTFYFVVILFSYFLLECRFESANKNLQAFLFYLQYFLMKLSPCPSDTATGFLGEESKCKFKKRVLRKMLQIVLGWFPDNCQRFCLQENCDTFLQNLIMFFLLPY